MAWEWADDIIKWATDNIDFGDVIDAGTAIGGGIINNNAIDKATQAQDEAAKKAR